MTPYELTPVEIELAEQKTRDRLAKFLRQYRRLSRQMRDVGKVADHDIITLLNDAFVLMSDLWGRGNYYESINRLVFAVARSDPAKYPELHAALRGEK